MNNEIDHVKQKGEAYIVIAGLTGNLEGHDGEERGC